MVPGCENEIKLKLAKTPQIVVNAYIYADILMIILDREADRHSV